MNDANEFERELCGLFLRMMGDGLPVADESEGMNETARKYRYTLAAAKVAEAAALLKSVRLG